MDSKTVLRLFENGEESSSSEALCILLRVYQLNIGITSVRNKVFFGARFYCERLTTCFGPVWRPSLGGSQTQKISKAVTIYSTDPLSRYA
jgi:hypothetical protein